MQKQLGAIMLISGTCIGSGIIALPMILAKLGIIPSILLMIVIWSLMYYTSLINLELNLQAGRGLPLAALAEKFAGKNSFSGRCAKYLSVISMKLLSYSLLAVFIYGLSSVLQKLVMVSIGHELTTSFIATCCAAFSIIILFLPLKSIDYINRLLFIVLLIVVAFLLGGLVLSMKFSNLPLFWSDIADIQYIQIMLPVVFTSFGFQVIFHTLTNYCDRNSAMLKKAFLWGTLIPTVVYIVWTCSILGVIYNNNPSFYATIMDGKADVGDLIKELSNIAQWDAIQLLVWVISILAITTSILGVGIGLLDSIKHQLEGVLTIKRAIEKTNKFFGKTCINLDQVLPAILTILPAYLIAILIPNAFIVVLGFAGMILSIIAVLLPSYLFFKAKIKKPYYNELKMHWLIMLSVLFSLLVMCCEIFHMVFLI